MTIYIGADHGGFKLKEKLKKYLANKGFVVTDFGAFSYNSKDDYPHYAKAVARQISKTSKQRGILICRSGVGMAIAANRFKRVRAGLCYTPQIARAGRNDDDMNVLVLEADFVSEVKAKKIADIFLRTKFSKAKRFVRRIREIDLISN